jgi:ClpP class serine protease
MAAQKLAAWPKRKLEIGEEIETDGGCYRIHNGVGIVSIVGPLAQYGGRWWYDGHCAIQTRIAHALTDPRVGAVLLEINSPGGVVAGCFDAIAAVRQVVKFVGKKVFAFAADGAYSAGYAWACVANEIHLPDTGGVGSVGVLSVMYSLDRMNKEFGIDVAVIRSGSQKADGHPDLPLDADAVAREQVEVDRLATIFATLVGESRKLKVASILALQGATVHGPAAVEAGYADSVTTFDAVLQKAEAAGRKHRMHSIATRLGLAPTATEAEINNEITKREVEAASKNAEAERRAKEAEAKVEPLAKFAADLAVRFGIITTGQRDARVDYLKAAPVAAASELASAAPVLPAQKTEPAEGPKGGGEYKPQVKTWTKYPESAEEQKALYEHDPALFHKLRNEARKGS